jgi:transcriptional regulator with XRE-family HTH domain
LRALRLQRELSLAEVEEQAGVSRSFLSLLERGETDISLDRFLRLALFYGMQPSELLLTAGEPDEPVIADIAAARSVERGEGVEYLIVREEHPQLMWTRIAPGARFDDLRAHRGEDLWLVVRGRVELLYGAGRHPLRAGQTARFGGLVPHAFANVGDEPAELVALATIPYW